MSDLVRANTVTFRAHVRTDGSFDIDYSGAPEELSIVVQQLTKNTQKGWISMAQLEQWAIQFNRIQPLIIGLLVISLTGVMLSWVLRSPEPQPQSMEVAHEQSA